MRVRVRVSPREAGRKELSRLFSFIGPGGIDDVLGVIGEAWKKGSVGRRTDSFLLSHPKCIREERERVGPVFVVPSFLPLLSCPRHHSLSICPHHPDWLLGALRQRWTEDTLGDAHGLARLSRDGLA